MEIKSLIQTNECVKNASVLGLNVRSAYYTQEVNMNFLSKVHESP